MFVKRARAFQKDFGKLSLHPRFEGGFKTEKVKVKGIPLISTFLKNQLIFVSKSKLILGGVFDVFV